MLEDELILNNQAIQDRPAGTQNQMAKQLLLEQQQKLVGKKQA
jgi:hypothetical protein